tara:strand:+ start:1765 stop:2100 length:336 start_codon:yes stop_codon:yes gene_type:complete
MVPSQAQESLSSTFDRVDADQNGEITQSEFIAYHTKRFQELVSSVDADGNQAIAKSELSSGTSSTRTSFLPPLIRSNSDEPGREAQVRKRAPAGAGGPSGPTSRRYSKKRE